MKQKRIGGEDENVTGVDKSVGAAHPEVTLQRRLDRNVATKTGSIPILVTTIRSKPQMEKLQAATPFLVLSIGTNAAIGKRQFTGK